MNQEISRAAYLLGDISLPGDKSIAHRAAMCAALSEGTSYLTGFPSSADPQTTLDCLRRLGVTIENEDELLRIDGVGLDGLQPPDSPLDCGNSGTTMRLLAGILAGQSFDSVLTGDASLQQRPMDRIAEPLRALGATVELTDGSPPITVRHSDGLTGTTYRLPVASAQVKSCALLAGLFAEGETTVVEPVPTRDHTERMLGLDVLEIGGERHISIQKGHRIPVQNWTVPADFSAAAFFLVAGSIVPQSELRLSAVGLNPSRNALLDVLRLMGGDVEITNERTPGPRGEPLADLKVRTAPLHGVTIDGRLIPNLIDELPVLAVAGACAEGTTRIRDAGELRVKETDRIDAMTTNLRRLGADIEEHDDGMSITGGSLTGAEVDSYGDHRVAMAMGVAGLAAAGTTTIRDADCASVSFPDFWDVLGAIRGG